MTVFASPTDIRAVRCPRCQAHPGQFCMGVRRRRKANHQERVKVYLGRK